MRSLFRAMRDAPCCIKLFRGVKRTMKGSVSRPEDARARRKTARWLLLVPGASSTSFLERSRDSRERAHVPSLSSIFLTPLLQAFYLASWSSEERVISHTRETNLRKISRLKIHSILELLYEFSVKRDVKKTKFSNWLSRLLQLRVPNDWGSLFLKTDFTSAL